MFDIRLNRYIFFMMVIVLLVSAGKLRAAETKTFQITAKKYEFIPGTINVNQGDKVVLQVTAVDTEHGFGISALNIDQVLPQGKTVTIEFVAEKKGEFTIKCTKFCGWGHFFMKGKLIVS